MTEKRSHLHRSTASPSTSVGIALATKQLAKVRSEDISWSQLYSLQLSPTLSRVHDCYLKLLHFSALKVARHVALSVGVSSRAAISHFCFTNEHTVLMYGYGLWKAQSPLTAIH